MIRDVYDFGQPTNCFIMCPNGENISDSSILQYSSFSWHFWTIFFSAAIGCGRCEPQHVAVAFKPTLPVILNPVTHPSYMCFESWYSYSTVVHSYLSLYQCPWFYLITRLIKLSRHLTAMTYNIHDNIHCLKHVPQVHNSVKDHLLYFVVSLLCFVSLFFFPFLLGWTVRQYHNITFTTFMWYKLSATNQFFFFFRRLKISNLFLHIFSYREGPSLVRKR